MTAVTARARPAAGGAQGSLTGTGALVRFVLRRDRVRIPAWVLGIALATVATANNLATLYSSPADRQTIAATMDSPAGVAMVGVNYGAGDYHYGVMMGHQMLWFTAILAALMSVLIVVRHTRTEEATGRAELVRAGVVGRHAMTAAALIAVTIANVALGVALAVGMGALGLEGITWTGSWLYGTAHVAVGLTFAGVAAVTVQITEHPRGASGLALAGVGLAYAVRAIGDVSDAWLSWASPIGWAQATQVYVADRWWALLPAVAAISVLVAVAVRLSAVRDVGAGLRRPRPGPAHASSVLAHPLGLAFRLHRAALIGWAVAMLFLGVMYGSVLADVEQMLTDIQALEEFIPDVAGVDLTEAFAARITVVLAIIASTYAIMAALKVRTEETSGRAEPVLATGVSQQRWLVSHVVAAMVGSVVVLLCAGLGIGVAGAASTGDASLFGDLVAAALVYTPALWITVAVVVALFGVAPRVVMVVWVGVLYSFVVVYLGGLLQLPEWSVDVSPFGAAPQLPLEDLTLTPLVVQLVVAAVLVGVGAWGFRRRDLQSAT